MANRILVLNGPNLNLQGMREPAIYGKQTLTDIENELAPVALRKNAQIVFFQTNHEGALIDRVHLARTDGTDFIIINAGAWTHTSIALRDALVAASVRFIEVHLSNLHRREKFRQRSYLSELAVGTIVGLGAAGYRYALDFALDAATPTS